MAPKRIPQSREVDISAVFDLVDEGPPTNIAREKDQMIDDAVWEEHQRKIGSKRSVRARLKLKRR